MGLAIKELVTSKEIELNDLRGNILAFDTYNLLYQFLTTIRSRDGSLLTDTKGRITSHLVGLFSRTTHFMEKGIKPVFVFDGKPPALKEQERERRKEIKQEAERKYQVALEEQDQASMKKYASRTTRLTKEMIDDAKQLITALGCPIVQAPSEGEAQAAFMAQTGDVSAAVSQDFDALMFGCPKLLRNLSVAGRRKAIHKLGYVTVKPELIELANVLNELGIDRDQLIILGILVGTDYNKGGVKGIGPKNALKLVKEHKKDFAALFAKLPWDFPVSWQQIYDTIAHMDVTKHYQLDWKPIEEEQIKKLLIEHYGFAEARVQQSLQALLKEKEKKQQRSLGDF